MNTIDPREHFEENLAKVQRYLNSMGRTSTDVANHLRKKKILGLKSTAYNPVVRAIYKKVPLFIRGLRTIKTRDYWGLDGKYSFTTTFTWGDEYDNEPMFWIEKRARAPELPQPVQNFIGEFFEGGWWDLCECDDDDVFSVYFNK